MLALALASMRKEKLREVGAIGAGAPTLLPPAAKEVVEAGKPVSAASAPARAVKAAVHSEEGGASRAKAAAASAAAQAGVTAACTPRPLPPACEVRGRLAQAAAVAALALNTALWRLARGGTAALAARKAVVRALGKGRARA
jgi:hypothetical protein